MAKSGRMELRENIYGHYRFIFNYCDVIGIQSYRIRWKTHIKGYYALQTSVIRGHRGQYQSKARMRHPISD